MSPVSKSRKLFFIFVVALPLFSVILSFLAHVSRDNLIKEQLKVLSLDSIPDFKLVDQNGDTITRKSLEGKILVSNFFFASCPGICRDMAPQMSRLNKFLQKNEKMREKFILLSHTVDPMRDSVPVLKKYADLYGADGRIWHLLTGDRQQLYDLTIKFYKLPAMEAPEDSLHPFAHSERFVLVDRQGFIRGYYNGTDSTSVNQLIDDMGNLDMMDGMIKRKKERAKEVEEQDKNSQ